MRKWLIKLLGGIMEEKPVNELVPVQDTAVQDTAPVQDVTVQPVPDAPVQPVPATNFDKVKSVLVLVDAGIDQVYDDALALAQKVGGDDVSSKLKVFLNVAGFAVPAFDDIVAFIVKHG